MANGLTAILFNEEGNYASELRAHLNAYGGIKIVAEIDEPALLTQTISQLKADVLVANLDPQPEANLALLGEITTTHPAVAVFAICSSTDGPLILKAMNLGLKRFVPKPIDQSFLDDALDQVAAQRSTSSDTGRLITVMGTAGGVGATFLATNLAVELAQLDKGNVAVVDLDYRFGQVATLLDVDCTFTIADLCASPEALEFQVIKQALVKHSSGVYVLARPSSFAQADNMTAANCVGVLSKLLEHYAFVVVDGPSRFDQAAKSVLDFTDLNLMLVQLLVPSVRNALRIVEGMRESGVSLEKNCLVCNRFGRDSAHLSLQDVESTLSMRTFASIPDDWATVSGSINLGEPLVEQSPKSKVRLAIQEIAERLHAPDSDSDEKDDRKKGLSLIGRIFANQGGE
jgi:pilus assembly protein CpaE